MIRKRFNAGVSKGALFCGGLWCSEAFEAVGDNRNRSTPGGVFLGVMTTAGSRRNCLSWQGGGHWSLLL